MEAVLGAADIEILRRGREFEALVKSPAWKWLLDWLEHRSDKAMTEHKNCLSTDRIIEHVMKMRWRERDETLTAFQKFVYDTVETKRQLVQRILDEGGSPEALEHALSLLPPSVV